MKTPIVVHGAAGRMGRQILELAAADSRFEIAAAVEAPGHPAVGSAVAAGAVITDDLTAACVSGRVVIDFTAPSATMRALGACRTRRVALVVGTTGFCADEEAALRRAASEIPIFFSPNMALGMEPFIAIIRKAAQSLRGYDIEICETHHAAKKDAPSGTALKIAAVLCKTLGRDPDRVLRHGRHGAAGPRTPEEIGVHAVRLGDIVGEHTVLFAAPGEVISISHRCHSRAVFARGALEAARFVASCGPGWYGMADLLRHR